MKPFIFLFTFIYNDSKHLDKLFTSLKKQTSTNFLYYFYDDCSTENYSDQLNSLKKELSKKGIKTFYEKGQTKIGINKSTEHCLQILKNRFSECTHFMWINSDDWLESNAVERLSIYIKKNPDYAIYMPNMTTHCETSNLTKYDKHIFKKSKNFIIDSLYTEQIYNHFLVNFKLFNQINPKCLIYNNVHYKIFYNDIAILFLAAAYNLKILYISENLSNFLSRKDSASAPCQYLYRDKVRFFIPQEKYIKEINSKYLPIYNKIVRISFTHIVCAKLVNNKEFKKSKIYFHKNLKIYKELKLQKDYMYPTKSSFVLYHFPRLYRIIHKLKSK